MSLDVYLNAPSRSGEARSVIFVREDGATRKISRKEWDERYPDREPVEVTTTDEVYWANITHNLSKMADEAGIGDHLWRPEELGITLAGDLIKPLQEGLWKLKTYPETFKKFNAPNGWGKYENLVSFVEKYLDACIDNPQATVHASR